jgi:hypothetical protein
MNQFNQFLISEGEFLEFFEAHVQWVQACLADRQHESWMPHFAFAIERTADGAMIAGDAGPLSREGRTPLLDWFWHGFSVGFFQKNAE